MNPESTSSDGGQARHKPAAKHILLVIALLVMLLANAFLASHKNRLVREIEQKDARILELERRLGE